MDRSIAVEIEDSSFVQLLELREGSRGKLNLKVPESSPDKAKVRLFLVSGKEDRLLSEITIVPPDEDSQGGIELIGGFLNGELTIELRRNGEILERRTLRLPAEQKLPPGVMRVVLTASALVLTFGIIAVSIANLYGGRSSSKTGVEVSSVTDREAEPLITDLEIPADESQSELSAPEDPPIPATDQSASGTDLAADPDGPAVREVSYRHLIYFLPEDHSLTSGARKELQSIWRRLEDLEDSIVTITGHCALYGTERGRSELSVLRAKAAYDFLVQQGWRPENESFIIGRGGENPVTFDQKEQHLNRRVEISIEYSG